MIGAPLRWVDTCHRPFRWVPGHPFRFADLGGPITTDGRKLSAPAEVELSHIYLFKISTDLS